MTCKAMREARSGRAMGTNAMEIFPERVASTMYREGQSLKWEGRETQFQAEGTARAKPKKWTESNTFED